MNRIRPWMATAWVPGIALGLAACDQETPPEPPEPAVLFIAAEANPNPHNTISAVLTVTARGYDSARVRFWSEGGGAGESPAYPFDGDTVVDVPVLGLDARTTYSLETILIAGDSARDAVDTTAFTSGSLPGWIPRAGVLGTDTTPGYLAISYPDGPVIIDNTGKVVWYLEFPNGVLNTFQAHANGRYTLLGLGDTTNQFRVLDELGEQVGALGCVGLETRFHDLLVLEGGDAWMLCNETRTMDLSGLGGVDTARVTGTVVQHVSPDGEVLFAWNVFDHFAITDLAPTGRGGPNVNFTHGNGIEFDTDGNLLLSFRSLNEITKIDVATGAVLWRFGGLRNEFTILNDTKGSFERQHGLRRSAPGFIQLLDNGDAAPSRFVRYQLDPVTRTAILVMDFRDSDSTYTLVGGGTQYYANGHAIVTFGREGRVVEVDRFGNRVWELTGIDGAYVFRVQRFRSLYAPGRGEPTR